MFASSTIYHITSPDQHIAYYTRILDYVFIYLGLCASCLADISVITGGFLQTPVLTIVDLPIATLLVIIFFLMKRSFVSSDNTWVESRIENPQCGFNVALFSMYHDDAEFSATRQATSLLIAGSYFLSASQVFNRIEDQATAWNVLSLQIVSFVILVGGMTTDTILDFPNYFLLKKKWKTLAFPKLGCIITSHAMWHVLSFVSVVLIITAREIALHS